MHRRKTANAMMSSPTANDKRHSKTNAKSASRKKEEEIVEKDGKNEVADDAEAEAIARLFENQATQRENAPRRRRRSSRERRNRRSSRERIRNTRRHSRSPRRSRQPRRSRSLERKRSDSTRRHRRRSDSTDSERYQGYRYGGYVPRKRHPNATTGFDHRPADGYSQHDVRQGFSPLPCPTRQVYVGNLVPGMESDGELREIFNSALRARGYNNYDRPGMEPVVSVSMHSDGRYAFVELRSPEMATAALQLSGLVQLYNQAITVRRPSGYVDPQRAAAVHHQRALAFAAYNNGEWSAQQMFGNMGGQRHDPMTNAATGSVSSFLSIEGLIDLRMLRSDGAYTEIVQSLRRECGKYGAVVELKIPRPVDKGMAKELFNTGSFGKAFVQFADPSNAMHAKEGLMNMATGDKNLSITFVSQEVFSAIL